MRDSQNRFFMVACTVILLFFSLAMNAQPSQPLTPRQQAIVTIATLTAAGDLAHLPPALARGLDAGLTVNEEKEVLAQLYAYCGFPRSLGALGVLMKLVDERKAQGKHDEVGKDASPITSTAPKYERGKQVLGQLTGKVEKEPTGVNAFAPEIDRFLKEHLFADIFERDVLTYQERELATVSALVGLGGVEPMLQSHLGIGLRLGLTEAQAQQLLALSEASVGKAKADVGRAVLAKVLAAKPKEGR